MILILKLVSILMIVYGCLLMLKPEIFKKVITYISEGRRVYIAIGIEVVLGVIMMLASSACRISWFVLFAGALGVLSSIAFLFLKKKIITDLLDKLVGFPKKKGYIVGVIALVLGVLFILSI